jgi:hypothetical protein
MRESAAMLAGRADAGAIVWPSGPRVCTLIGGRNESPRLGELERVHGFVLEAGIEVVRHSEQAAPGHRGSERMASEWLAARGVRVEGWPTRVQAIAGGGTRAPVVLALAGGQQTQSVARVAAGRGVAVVDVGRVHEPRVWNRHHGRAPGRSVYIGRAKTGPTPLGNPWRLEKLAADVWAVRLVDRGDVVVSTHEDRAAAESEVLDRYRVWLWRRVRVRRSGRWNATLESLGAITADHAVVCSCWPRRCHAEAVVGAWRWLNAART